MIGQDEFIEPQLKLRGLMREPQPHPANGDNRPPNRGAQRNEYVASLVHGGDQDAGDLCAGGWNRS